MKRFFLGVFAGIYFLSNHNLVAAGDAMTNLKENFPNQFHNVLQTRFGEIHFQDVGPKNATPIVLVHGVSGPLSVWDKNMDILLDAGYRVIRFDLFGRGFSERLGNSSYSLSTYVEEVEELISGLKVIQPIYIVGSSLGAIVSTEYTLQHPNKVAGVILIGPAGFPISVPPVAKLRSVPFLGDLIFKAFGHQTILKQNRKYFVDENPPTEFWEFFTAQLDVPGTAEAMRLTMANAPVQSFIDSYKKLGELHIPVGVIWGRQDITFPHSNNATLLNKIPHAKLITIENAGHLPQYERSTGSNSALIEHLSRFESEKTQASELKSPRLSYSSQTTTELTPAIVDNDSLFEDPFFKTEETTSNDLELAPGIIKKYLFPTLYKNVTTSIAMFTCDYAAAADLVADKAVRPVSIGMGRAILTLTSYRYNQVRGIQPYNEVAVSVLVTSAKKSSLQLKKISLAQLKNFEAYVVSMPVTSLENRIRGRSIWGLPKDVHPIELRQVANDFVTTVTDDSGESLLQFSVPMEGKEERREQSMVIHSVLNGRSLVATTKSSGTFYTTTNLKGFLTSSEGSRFTVYKHTKTSWLNALKVNRLPFHTEFSFGTKNLLTLPAEVQTQK